MSSLFALWNVMRKELTQTLRDRRMVFMLIAAPVIQFVAFGYAVNRDVDRIPTVVCDQDQTRESRDLIDRFFANGTFRRHRDVGDPEAAQGRLESGEAAVALIVPRGFAVRQGRRDDPEVQVLIDGSDSTRAQVASSDATQFLQMYASAGLLRAPGPHPPTLTPRILYNQRLSSAVYMIPGIVASLLNNVTALLTAMGLTREKETGTLEQVLVTPIRPVVFLAGKCLPFIMIGLIDTLAVLILGSYIFDLPLHGSLAVVGLGSFLYVFSTLGVGILLATISVSQQQAILAGFSFILPAMLLSGFMSPIESMPRWLQPLTLANPYRHFIEILRGCLLKRATLTDMAPQLFALVVIGVTVLGISVRRFRKRIA